MKLGKWQMSEIKQWNGPLFDPEATLKALWGKAPEKIRKAMVKLNAYHGGKSLEDQLEALGTKYVSSVDDFYWEVLGDSRRNVQLIEARFNGNIVSANDLNIGAGGAYFELVFGEDYFFNGEVIVGEKNEKYPIRIVKEPQAEGDNVRYICQAWGLPQGIPGAELISGKKFSKEYAPVEKGLSREVGGVSRPGVAKVRGTLSTIRIDHKVAGDVDDYAVAIGFPIREKNGTEKVITVLSSHEEWLVEKEFSHYKIHALAYGRTNLDETGETYETGISGRKITMGPGLREQLEQTNSIYYNQFSIEMLEAILMQLSYNKLGINDREFVLSTGQGGAALFHKAILKHASGWQSFMIDGNGYAIQKTQSELHNNALRAGFQFTEYLGPNGIKVKIEIDEMKDDPIRNKIKMPGTQLPAESFRIDIIYKGTKENPNIQKLMYEGHRRFGGELKGYSSGFRNPFTKEMNVNYMSTTEDSAMLTRFAYLGVVVYDPDTCACLIPSVLQ